MPRVDGESEAEELSDESQVLRESTARLRDARALQEALHGHLVGGVQDGRGRHAAFQGLERQADTGEAIRVRRMELQPAD